MSKKSQRKKRGINLLVKFLKNRRSVSVALGICLAIAASAYIATAKFSAEGNIMSAPAGTVPWTKTHAFVNHTVKVVEQDGKTPVANAVIKWDYYAIGNKVMSMQSEGSSGAFQSTDKDGISHSFAAVCQKNKTKRACVFPADKLTVVDKIYPTAWKNGNRISESKRYFSGSTVKDSTITIKLSKTSSSSSVWAITDQKIKYTVKVVDQNGKPVSGSAVTMAWSSGVNIKDNTKGKDATTSMGLTKSDGTVIFDAVAINICKKGSQQKSCYKIGDSVFFIGKLTPNVWKDGKKITKNTSYFSSSNIKDKTITIKMGSTSTSKAASAVKVAAGKVSTAAKKVTGAIIGSSKSAKVSTTPTKKDKATFSEALPATKTSLTRNLNFQFKDASTKNPTAGPVKITVVYKICSKNGCGGDVAGKFPETSFNVTAKANGMYALVLGVTNLPEVKTSGRKTTTTNRYFFFYGDPTHIVRHLYISDINGGNQKEVPIGGFPFATKTEDAAKKFQIKLFTFDKVISKTSSTGTTSTTKTSTTQSTIGVVQSDGSTNGSANNNATTYTDPYSSTKPDTSWLSSWWQSIFNF